MRIRMFSSLLTVLIGLSGCGGATVPVTGRVTLDGQPLPYGQALIRNESVADNDVGQAMIPVRNGVLEFAGGAGVPPGECSVTVVVFQGNPPAAAAAPSGNEEVSSVEAEPVVLGTWTGKISVDAGQEITIDVKSAELKKPNANSEEA